jgi:hypothetical protein
MTYQNSSILCFSNLNSNKFDLEVGEYIIFPQNFPKIESIEWDYDSFIKNIYGRQWIIERDCISKNYEYYLSREWGLIANITDISDEICTYSLNDKEIKYNFKMKVNLTGGRLKEIMEKINENSLINNIINNSEEDNKFEIELYKIYGFQY